MINRTDAEKWLKAYKEIVSPIAIPDETNYDGYYLADLLAEFANYIIELKTKNNDTRISDQMG